MVMKETGTIKKGVKQLCIALRTFQELVRPHSLYPQGNGSVNSLLLLLSLLVLLGFELRTTLAKQVFVPLDPLHQMFCVEYFRDRVSQTIHPGCL
jgi:hypothetical protein